MVVLAKVRPFVSEQDTAFFGIKLMQQTARNHDTSGLAWSGIRDRLIGLKNGDVSPACSLNRQESPMDHLDRPKGHRREDQQSDRTFDSADAVVQRQSRAPLK